MKYIVELKYTNPSHEHVSLRRRVETRNSVVEAKNEEEAILRASRQQRALGFMIKEAKIIKPEPKIIAEGSGDASVNKMSHEDLADYIGEKPEWVKQNRAKAEELANEKTSDLAEQINEMKQGKEYTKKELVDKMKAGNWETSYDIKPGKHVELTHRSGKKVSVYVKEEVEQMEEGKGYSPGWMLKKDKDLGAKVKEKIDLAKKRQASYGKPEAGVSVKKEEVVAEAKGEPPAEFMPSDTKLPRIKVPAKPKPGVRKRGPVGSFNKKGVWNPGVRNEEVEQVEEAKVSTVGASKASDSELANYLKKKVKKAQSGQGFKVSKPVKEEEMKPWVKAAQKKFDAQTKAQQMGKKQAGTLAAQRQRELARKTDLDEARTFKDVTAWKEAAKGHGYIVKQYAPDHHQAWTEDKRSGAPRVVGLFKDGKGDLTPPSKKVNEDLRRVKGKIVKSMNKLIQTAKNRKKALAVNVAPVMQEEKE